MNAVVIFDISNGGGTIVRERLRAIGYYHVWISDENNAKRTVYLPQNMVWKPNIEFKQAIDDLNTVVTQINLAGANPQIGVLRCVVLNSTPWMGIFGTPV